MYDPQSLGESAEEPIPDSKVVAQPVQFRGEASSDRKIKAVQPLWQGLSQTPPPDPEDYEDCLVTRAPNARAVTRWAANRACLARFCNSPEFTLSPLLLYGPNGVGKTSLARILANAAGLKSQVISVSGKNDPRTLLGTSPGYTTGLPALPAQIMARTGQSNPVVILDEIDKHACDPARGSWVDGMLPFLEHSTSSSLYDEYLAVDIDFSGVSWIFTANSLDGLPNSFLDRLTCFELTDFVGVDEVYHSAGSTDGQLRLLSVVLGLPQKTVAKVIGGMGNSLDFPNDLSPRKARTALVDRFAEALRNNPGLMSG